MKKIILSIVLSLFLTCVSYAQEIRVGLGFNSSSSIMLFGIRDKFPQIAKEMGIKDVTLGYNHYKSSTYSWPVFLKDQLDVIMTSISKFAVYNTKKPNDVKALFAINGTEQQLLCHPSYKSVDDLKKNKPVVAIAGKKQSGHLGLYQIANKYFDNTNYFEERIVVPSTKQLLQVIASGSKEIGCAIWGSPIQGEIKSTYGWNKIQTSDVKLINVFIVKKEWAEKNPKLAEALIKTYQYVAADFVKNPRYYVKLYVKNSGVDRDVNVLTKHYIDDGYRPYPKIHKDLDNYLSNAVRINFIKSKSYNNIEEIFWNPTLLK